MRDIDGSEADLPDDKKLVKNKTNVSVLSVYDIYGLEIALAYLDCVSTRATSYAERSWVEMYLDACEYEMMSCGYEIAIDVYSGSSIQRLRNRLEHTLKHIDASQPRASESLVNLGLVIPIEVLARILKRTDISPSITKCLYSVGHVQYPTVSELDGIDNKSSLAYHVGYVEDLFGGLSKYEICYMAPLSSYEVAWAKYCLLKKRDRDYEFVLKNKWSKGAGNGLRVEYSLETYDTFYNNREYTNKMLRDMRDRLTTCQLDEAEICSWVVQLSCDTMTVTSRENSSEVHFSNLASLRDELVRLIDLALEKRCKHC
ncbi:Hypothetical protein POVR2_LOCUS162 [uncultured virus]|nr:Hypothetical protein POVR2_LOCUS162 [uncultured virus]